MHVNTPYITLFVCLMIQLCQYATCSCGPFFLTLFSVPQSNRKRMCLRFYCNYVWFVKLLNNIYLNISIWINTHQVITQPLEAMMYGIFVMYRNHMVLIWFYTNSIARTSVSLPFTVNWFISAAVTVWNITW